MITNDNGEVAIKHTQPQRVLVQKTPTGTDYVFAIRANISLAWVDPQDVDNILARKRGCCGGKKIAYVYANESDVRRWTNNGGR